MDKKRGFVTQLIRHLIQLAAFILFPGLFILVFSAVRDILMALVNGSFSLNGLRPQVIMVFTVFLSTSLWGRFFCGFLCSFGMLVSGNLSVISSSIPTAGFVLLLAIFAGSFFVSRFFCRYLCPLGALFTITSVKRFYKIERQSSSCTNCGLCVKKCSMGINITEHEAVTSGECIHCMQCLTACPKESLSANPSGAIAGTAAAAAVGGMAIFGNSLSNPVAETVSNGQFDEKVQKGRYTDGVYTGYGKGFRGDTEVQVTVENGYITDITMLSFEDDKEFFNKAKSSVINAIITNQTYDVDAVSGATFSSNSIIDAVENALGADSDRPEQPDADSRRGGRHGNGRHRNSGLHHHFQ